MKRYIIPISVISALLVILLSVNMTGTQAWLSSAPESKGLISSAKLDFTLNVYNLDLGEIVPGDSGAIDIKDH